MNEPATSPSTRNQAEALAKTYTSEAISLWVDVMRDPKVKTDQRLRASELIMERAHGKARQPEARQAVQKRNAQQLTVSQLEQLLKYFQTAARAGNQHAPRQPVREPLVIEGQVIPRAAATAGPIDTHAEPTDAELDDLLA